MDILELNKLLIGKLPKNNKYVEWVLSKAPKDKKIRNNAKFGKLKEQLGLSIDGSDYKKVLEDILKNNGIDFSDNLSIEELEKIINENLEDNEASVKREDEIEDEVDEDVFADNNDDLSEAQKKEPIKKTIEKLHKKKKKVRCIITNLDPNESQVPSTVLSVSNRFINIPPTAIIFNEIMHYPEILLDTLESTTYSVFLEKKDKDGKKYTVSKQLPKYNVKRLPDLTQEELDKLKKNGSLK